MNLIVSAIGQGLLWGILGLGLYLTFRILKFPDMTVEGTFPFGACVCVSLITQGTSPFIATLASFGAGLLTGFLTGILYTKGKIPVLLAGILVMTGIYSINLRVLGKATVGLLNQNTLLNTGMLRELPNSFPSVTLGLIMRSQLYAKSLPMPMVIGALKRLELIRNHPEFQQKLWEITRALQGGLKENGFNLGVTNSPVTPVFLKGGVNEATNLVVDLRENYKLFCSIVVYPVIPKGEIILRVIPTAAHTLEDVNYTIDAFKAVRDRLESGYYANMPMPMRADEGFSVR